MSGEQSGGTPFIHKLEDGLLFLLMSALVLLAVAQIALRNAFGITFLWSEPLVRHLVLWCGFLGALIATRLDKHIRIDAVLLLLRGRVRMVAELAGNLVSAAVCALLARVAVGFLADERAFGSVGLLDLPTWTLQLVFPLTFALMSLRYAARGLRCLVDIASPSDRHSS